jgi:DNA-directed RNA polymerase subunit K
MRTTRPSVATYTKFEIARLIGARALQIKMGAPILVKIPKRMTRPLDIAKLELEKGVLPITVKRKESVENKEREKENAEEGK